MTARRPKGTGSVRKVADGVYEISAVWEGRRRYRRVRGGIADAHRALAAFVWATSPSTIEVAEQPAYKGSLGEWLDTWIELHDGKESTTRAYRYAFTHIRPSLGSKQIEDLKPLDIRRFHAELSKTGLAPRTQRLIAKVLNIALESAVQMEELRRNPAAGIPLPKVPKDEVQIPTQQQVEDVLDLFKEYRPVLYPLVKLIVYTGTRRGEAAGLRWENVDLVNGRIRIKEQLVEGKGGRVHLADSTKSGEMRQIDLDPATVAMLEEHRAEQDRQIAAGMTNNGIVFTDKNGDFIKPRLLLDWVSKFSRQTGAQFKVHDLRHLHASVLLQNKVPITTVSKRLGHSSIQTTLNYYSHLLPGDDKAAAQVFAQYMGKEAVIVGA